MHCELMKSDQLTPKVLKISPTCALRHRLSGAGG